jgi:hypothetical protein
MECEFHQTHPDVPKDKSSLKVLVKSLLLIPGALTNKQGIDRQKSLYLE